MESKAKEIIRKLIGGGGESHLGSRRGKAFLSVLLSIVMVIGMLPISAVETRADTSNYLTFTAEEANSSVTFNYLSGTAYYSTDNGSTWTACAAAKSATPTTITLTNVGDKVT